MDGRPHTAYIASNVGDRAAKASSARRLMVRSGWSSGTRVSMSMNTSMLTCGSCSPRIPTTSLRDGSTVSGARISPEEPQTTKVGVFHQPANEVAHVVRFYTGSVLFEGVDQAVCVFRLDTGVANPAHDIQVAGGFTVATAQASTLAIPRDRVLASAPGTTAWAGAWLVAPNRLP